MTSPRTRIATDRWTGLLLAVSIIVAVFMAYNHNFVPMWIEGMPEYEHQILAALGYVQCAGGCEVLVVQGHCLPLSVNPYIGAASTYLDLPASYLWLSGLSNDLYSYRYTSIAILLTSGWLFYAILRRHYGNPCAFYGGVTLLVCPIELLVSLTDHRTFLTLTLFVMAMFFFGTLYRKSRHPGYLWACCFTAGLSLWTRTEAFVLPFLSLVLYGVLFRREEAARWWRTLTGRHSVVGWALLSFGLGAAPVLVYNIRCSGNGLLQFVLRKSVPNLMSGSAGQNLLVRFRQFFSFNLLNELPLNEMHVRNLVLAVAFFAAAVVILGSWFRRRQADYPLFALGLLLPMFYFLHSGGPRELHLHVLQPAVIAVVISGCARLFDGRRWVMHAILACVAAGTGAVTVLDWRAWQDSSPSEHTFLNQSDPGLLVSYLKEHHSADELFFTNIGLEQYIEYVSRGKLPGKNILNWYSTDDFASDVRMALMGSGRRRVFVAIPPERDGMEGTLPRTQLLYSVLDSEGVSYTTVRLKSPRNFYLYDLVVVEKGVVSLSKPVADKLVCVVHSVSLNPVRDGVVSGAIYGTGFRRGDAVIVDGGAILQSAFESERFITVAIPVSEIRGKQALRIEIVRPSSMERSRPFPVVLNSPQGR